MAGNQFINIFAREVVRNVTRLAMAFGIKKGIDMLATRGKDPAKMTAEEQAAAARTQRSAREAVKRARQAARITRKLR
ncbi:hypothetical protein [Paracoccus sp. S1E-3]|uniref:hypothetical protein n=1 Tax=Paracoccus sp. S1E-3 TaxID=2756130 RepID=UPI0015EF2FE5|nr:hypothetical protein [Paracoccus sp. S1E-3]MBA4491224.1 hypothetical protein [Paracoccus sp. S1E-3]